MAVKRIGRDIARMARVTEGRVGGGLGLLRPHESRAVDDAAVTIGAGKVGRVEVKVVREV